MAAIHLIKPYFRSQWRIIVGGLGALITVDVVQLTIPRIIKRAVDDLTVFRAGYKDLLIYAAMIALMAVLIGFFRYVWRRCLLGMARRIEQKLRNRLFSHLQTLSAAYFDRTLTGDLMAHATNDIQQIRMAAGMGLVAMNDAIVMGTAAVGFMLYIHVGLTLYVLIPMPLIVISTRLLSKRMHRGYRRVQAAFADLTEAVRERFAGIRVIKAHNGQADAAIAVGKVSKTYIDENIRLVSVTGLFFPLMLLLTNLSLAIVLFFGGRHTILAQITPGEFVAFISYLNLLTWPMMALGWVTNLIQRGSASLERLNIIFQQIPDIKEVLHAQAVPKTRGEIGFEDLTFAYDGKPVLQHINIRIHPGCILGVIGPPASGKSTLLSLVPRLYDASSGRVTMDGRDLRDLRLDDLRVHIAHVPQEPFLFAATVRENILFGYPDAGEERLAEVIDQVDLTQTLASFPQGLDTMVGEKGVLLSGGQKQRVALARALIKDAPVLLLDDPISQVDTATGRRIVNTLRHLAHNKTMIIVSHRLSAVRFADQIVCLQTGRIVEAGSHSQLMVKGGYYARVYALQELEDAV